MKKRRMTMLMVAMTLAATVSAQDEPKFTAKPSGRILFDAAYVNPQHQEDKLKSGVGIPDMRVGVGFSSSISTASRAAPAHRSRKRWRSLRAMLRSTTTAQSV